MACNLACLSGRYTPVMRTTAFALAAFACLGLGCASPGALRKAEAEVEVARTGLQQAKAEVERLRAELAEAASSRDEATKLLREDPDRSAQQVLKAKMEELRLAAEEVVTAKLRMEVDRAQIAQLEATVAGLSKALAGNAEAESLAGMAVSYLEREGFKVGRVKARVTDDWKTYVVLSLDSSFRQELMIVEEGGLLGWDRFAGPKAFWFKSMFRGIDILDSTGNLKSLSEARIYEDDLEARILQAAGR